MEIRVNGCRSFEMEQYVMWRDFIDRTVKNAKEYVKDGTLIGAPVDVTSKDEIIACLYSELMVCKQMIKDSEAKLD